MKQNKTTQSPAPDAIQEGGYTKGKIKYACYLDAVTIFSDVHGCIAQINHDGKHKEEHGANAARIVKCWNEYDGLKAENEQLREANRELVEALKLAHKNLQGENAFLSQPEWEKIESAIQKHKQQ